MNNNIWEKKAYYEDIQNTHKESDEGNDIFSSKFFNELKNLENSKILDVGCGEGWLINKLSQKMKENNHFFGIDVSKTGIEHANLRNIKNCIFSTYDGKTFPYKDNEFQAVISSFVFEHLQNPLEIFNEMYRVVKKDGIIIIACPNFGSPLFKSPCNKTNKMILMLLRFINEVIKPEIYFKNDFKWNKVTPIELPENIHISDYDTMCEPNLSSFEKFLSNDKNKYTIIKLDSMWESFDYKKISPIKKIIVVIARKMGLKKLFRFQYFGSFFFAIIKKR
jgi:ubiquinone/menaquinone biosynthesis C-methylase UbiE